MQNQFIETIVDGLEAIALIIRANFDESGVHFFTPDSFFSAGCFYEAPYGKKNSTTRP